jgi:hypothetical protein
MSKTKQLAAADAAADELELVTWYVQMGSCPRTMIESLTRDGAIAAYKARFGIKRTDLEAVVTRL